ncbi:unnamed protein product [Urochloa decumbens]|uniref:Uncharacterized protein n=1 Tax=Urochloa decumbens TaxID=240449 RepID=A0ABC9B1U6_9POAL
MSNSSSPSAAGTGGCTTSVVAEHTVTGSHVLRIECFSQTKGLGERKCIKSDPFSVGGHTWVVRYYPDGDRTDSCIETDWISVDVWLAEPASRDEEVRAGINFSILNEQGKPVQAFKKFCSDKTQVFPPLGRSSESWLWGYEKFIKRKPGLERSSYLKGDCLRIKCDVTVVEFGVRKEGAKRRRITVPPSDLHQDLGRLLSSQRGGDVVFKVGDEFFPAHRSVLAARSSVFNAEFFGPMNEKTDGHIRIEDMEANVFKVLLDFMYTDSLPAMDEGEEIVMAQHLLVAEDRYDLKRLKLICEDKLCNHINIETVATTMALAEQHGSQGLRESCFEFLSTPGNLKKIKATDGYQHLKASCPSFLEELVDKFAT